MIAAQDLQTDASLIVSFALGWDLKDYAKIVKVQYMFFYSAAAFWKFNRAFMDPTASCATIFTLQNLGLFFGEALAKEFVQPVALAAPAITLILESAVGVGMFVKPQMGAVVAFVLHTLISITPRPNNISSFSAKCAPKLLLFLDDVDGLGRFVLHHWRPIAVFVPVYVAFVSQLSDMQMQDYATAIFLPQFLLYVLCLCTARRPLQKEKTPSPRGFRVVLWTFGCLALVYSYVLIPLGLQDLGAPSMYSNLNYHGGSNHFLMPTAYFQRTRANDTSSIFYGGVVRVEATNSSYIQKLYPVSSSFLCVVFFLFLFGSDAFTLSEKKISFRDGFICLNC